MGKPDSIAPLPARHQTDAFNSVAKKRRHAWRQVNVRISWSLLMNWCVLSFATNWRAVNPLRFGRPTGRGYFESNILQFLTMVVRFLLRRISQDFPSQRSGGPMTPRVRLLWRSTLLGAEQQGCWITINVRFSTATTKLKSRTIRADRIEATQYCPPTYRNSWSSTGLNDCASNPD